MAALFASRAGAQINVYNDGPIALDIRVKRCWSNQNFDITGLQYLLFGPNEYTYKLRLRDVENLDGADWTAWKTVTADNQGYVWSPDDNQIVFSYVYSGTQAPTNFEFEYEAFRNRCGGRTSYDCCEIFGLCTGIYDANRKQGVGRVPFAPPNPTSGPSPKAFRATVNTPSNSNFAGVTLTPCRPFAPTPNTPTAPSD